MRSTYTSPIATREGIPQTRNSAASNTACSQSGRSESRSWFARCRPAHRPPPPGSPSRLFSGARAEAVNSTNCSVQLWAQPTESTAGDYATNRPLGTLCTKDEVTVVTNTPPSSTTVTTEGYVWWRVLVKKSGTVGWVKEVRSDGSGARSLDLIR